MANEPSASKEGQMAENSGKRENSRNILAKWRQFEFMSRTQNALETNVLKCIRWLPTPLDQEVEDLVVPISGSSYDDVDQSKPTWWDLDFYKKIEHVNKLDQMNRFRKSLASKDDWRGHVEVLKLFREHADLFDLVGKSVKTDLHKCIHFLCTRLIHEAVHYVHIDDNYFNRTRPIKYFKAFRKRMNTRPVYQNLNKETKELLFDYLEKYVMTSLYHVYFSIQTFDFEAMDLKIQEKITELNWLRVTHVTSKIDDADPLVQKRLHMAITELSGLDLAKTPKDKLDCVVACCRNIETLLQTELLHFDDDFLPILILVVVKANPARLKSNIIYIWNFYDIYMLDKPSVRKGGISFDHMAIALSFFESLTNEKLTAEYLTYLSTEQDLKTVQIYIAGFIHNFWRARLLILLDLIIKNLKNPPSKGADAMFVNFLREIYTNLWTLLLFVCYVHFLSLVSKRVINSLLLVLVFALAVWYGLDTIITSEEF